MSTQPGLDCLTERCWTLVAPGYDTAVALVGWHRYQDALVSDIARGAVLEVGCGPAHLARSLLTRGVEYVGVDRNAAMVTRAGRRLARLRSAAGSGAIVRADATALPFGAASVDVVVATGVLGLLDRGRRSDALREMARVARREVRLLEPVGRADAPPLGVRARLIALVRDRPVDLAELTEAGLDPHVYGPPRLAGVYSMVRAVPAARPDPG